MEVLVYLVPLAIMLGTLGLAAFLWSLRMVSTTISAERLGGPSPTMRRSKNPSLWARLAAGRSRHALGSERRACRRFQNRVAKSIRPSVFRYPKRFKGRLQKVTLPIC